MNAKLPDDREQSTIETMEVGESAWVTPWSMMADEEGNLWMNLDTTPSDRGGTVELHIIRNKDGFSVDASCSSHQWTKGPMNARCAPVVDVKF